VWGAIILLGTSVRAAAAVLIAAQRPGEENTRAEFIRGAIYVNKHTHTHARPGRPTSHDNVTLCARILALLHIASLALKSDCTMTHSFLVESEFCGFKPSEGTATFAVRSVYLHLWLICIQQKQLFGIVLFIGLMLCTSERVNVPCVGVNQFCNLRRTYVADVIGCCGI